MVWCLSLALCVPVPVRAQPQSSSKTGSSSKSSSSAAQDSDQTKSGSAAGEAGADAGKAATAPDAAAPAAVAVDPSQTRKIVANEIFRDPKVEKLKLLDINKFPHYVKQPVQRTDLLELNAMAGGANANIDKGLIDRVVDAMVSKLTDHANIQSLIDPPQGQSASAPAARAIHEATTALLEPIFLARSAKNQSFLAMYNRVLLQKLTPLLKNHLIPRIQAMIVLGESGSLDMLGTYESQIKDPNQTIWVKLWALEGIVNITEGGGRLTSSAQIEAAKIVADLLEKEDDVPWPAQLRALEALSTLRQGFVPNRSRYADMANAAMHLLTDADSKLEVRAEAAKALGLMQIGAAVPKYNYDLVAQTTGLLAADLGAEIGTVWPNSPVRSAASSPSAKAAAAKKTAKAPAPSTTPKPAVATNPAKAKYLTALLVGPVYQAFDGVTGLRESGLLHAGGGHSPAYTENVFALVKAVAKASVDLIYSGARQYDDRKKYLAAQVAALRDFLGKNAPADRHLVPDGVAYPLPEAQADRLPAPQPQAAKPR